MTLTEKLLARAAGKSSVQAGENIWVKADVLMTHDVCGPGTIGVFKREFVANAKVWDRNRVVIIPDHYIFTADSKSNRNVDILREFAKEQTERFRHRGNQPDAEITLAGSTHHVHARGWLVFCASGVTICIREARIRRRREY